MVNKSHFVKISGDSAYGTASKVENFPYTDRRWKSLFLQEQQEVCGAALLRASGLVEQRCVYKVFARSKPGSCHLINVPVRTFFLQELQLLSAIPEKSQTILLQRPKQRLQ